MLDDEHGTRLWPSFVAWLERASAGDVVAAYEASRNPGVRAFMCYRVGRRGLHAALPMLLDALGDPDPGVRAEAADALYRLEDPRTGYDLIRRYAVEDDPAVRSTLALGLGCTGYRPAVPLLTDALAEADPVARACAAEALAALGAKEALPALRQAHAREADGHVRGRMRRAIDELEGG